MGLEYIIGLIVSFFIHGLFDLRASLAGEVLGLPTSQKKILSHLWELMRNNFASVRSQEKS